jgi:hypothetical protein
MIVYRQGGDIIWQKMLRFGAAKDTKVYEIYIYIHVYILIHVKKTHTYY